MAKYAVVENNVITGLYDTLPRNWSNISNFYLLEEDLVALQDLGWRLVQPVIPTYNPDTQYLGDTYHRIIDGEVIETQYVIDRPLEPLGSSIEYTEEQLLEIQTINHNLLMAELRTKRDSLLAETDFTQLADVIEIQGPDLSLAYKQYRQALRDLPNTYQSDISVIDLIGVIFPTLTDFIPTTTETPPQDNSGEGV